jgi:hypothetical protein
VIDHAAARPIVIVAGAEADIAPYALAHFRRRGPDIHEAEAEVLCPVLAEVLAVAGGLPPVPAGMLPVGREVE